MIYKNWNETSLTICPKHPVFEITRKNKNIFWNLLFLLKNTSNLFYVFMCTFSWLWNLRSLILKTIYNSLFPWLIIPILIYTYQNLTLTLWNNVMRHLKEFALAIFFITDNLHFSISMRLLPIWTNSDSY